ncbi:hypothetical protein PV11_03324 [Exophiala sideris]|uniref:Uncharacterized protein n=1 Tax=Exophiala sideris TaxID=1016849 RepID=A0A0D1ZLX0_9EURO|nr:hypothetical protein PV11_03324 [Exophiala sideris]
MSTDSVSDGPSSRISESSPSKSDWRALIGSSRTFCCSLRVGSSRFMASMVIEFKLSEIAGTALENMVCENSGMRNKLEGNKSDRRRRRCAEGFVFAPFTAELFIHFPFAKLQDCDQPGKLVVYLFRRKIGAQISLER